MLLLRRCFIVACACIILCVPTAGSTIGLPPLPNPPALPKLPNLPIPDVTDLLNGEAITTSLSDAVTGIPFLNDYQPGLPRGLAAIPHDSSGEFHLVAGSYWFDGRSYCLHAGKRAPASGSSYLYAPLKGPRAPIIEDILRNSASHLEIPQPTVQELIWAILARVKITDMQPEPQAAAAKLLSPAQLLELNTNAVAFIPADKFNALLAKVPDPMRPILDAENSLRGMLTSNATYQDMERVAVLPSVPEPGNQAQALALVRWSYDPHGFFLWFIPHTYRWTTTYLDVPGAVTEKTDQLGRIATLQDDKGDSLAVTYSPKRGNLTVNGDPQVQFYSLQSLQFTWQELGAHGTMHYQKTWAAADLVMVGVPSGNGKIPASDDSGNAQAQYDYATRLRDQFSDLLHQIHGQDNALPELMVLAEFRAVLKSVANDHVVDTAGVYQELNFPVLAWESALARSTGGRVAADVRAGVDQAFNPSNNTGVPQNSGSQRLAQSPNPYGSASGSHGPRAPGGPPVPGGGKKPPKGGKKPNGPGNLPPICYHGVPCLPQPSPLGQQIVAQTIGSYGLGGTQGLDPNLIHASDNGSGFNWQLAFDQDGNQVDPSNPNVKVVFDGVTGQMSNGQWMTVMQWTDYLQGGITISRTFTGTGYSPDQSIGDAWENFGNNHSTP